MKKLFVLALVLALTFASATPAAAKGGALHLYGTIETIDYSALTFEMKITSPEHYTGDVITVQVTSDTLLKECAGAKISFDDLAKGNFVRVTGTFADATLVAARVISYP